MLHKFKLQCVCTGKQIIVFAKSFDDAGDLFIDYGWSYDSFMGGWVCPKARIL